MRRKVDNCTLKEIVYCANVGKFLWRLTHPRFGNFDSPAAVPRLAELCDKKPRYVIVTARIQEWLSQMALGLDRALTG